MLNFSSLSFSFSTLTEGFDVTTKKSVSEAEQGPVYGIPPDLIRGPESDVLALSGEANWGIPLFQVDRLREATDNGAGVIVGLVDTGVDHTHPLLAPNFLAARNFTTNDPNYFRDVNGHGTHVSGTVAAIDPRIGMAPACKFLHGKGLSDGGSGSGDGIAAAIRWCVAQGAEIISMSLGSSGRDDTIISAMREVSDVGVWVVAAAGNSGGNTPDVDWPGRSEYAISVAALNPDKSPASFTNRGAKIDTAFAGVDIWSTRPGGGFQRMSGTSMSAPGAAGVLTLYRGGLKKMGRRIPTVIELRSQLFKRSTDTFTPGDDLRTGPGFVTPILLALDLNPDPPPVTETQDATPQGAD